MQRVFQLIAFLDSGDAIGDHARALARALGDRHGGFIVERAAPELAAQARRYNDGGSGPRPGPGDVLLYHMAHASPLAGYMAEAPATTRKIVDYHGITPPSFVRGWDPALAGALDRAAGDLAKLATVASLGLAHSEFTRQDLTAAGFPRTATVPVVIDPTRLATPPDAALLRRLTAGKRSADLLFVSRLAPSKRIEDLIKVFAVYRRGWCPGARLFLVGRADTGRYAYALHAFVARLGIEEVHLTGKVSTAELMAYYAAADVFVSMSEHEGFGIPWLEAMAFGVPVLAYAAGALPETIGDGGVLFAEKDYEMVAGLIDEVTRDGPLRERLREAASARVQHFGAQAAAEAIIGLVVPSAQQ